MTKFISKWKNEYAATDIATLAYPHAVTPFRSTRPPIGTVNSVEEAEALLDWFGDNLHVPKERGIPHIQSQTANRKLHDAMKRKREKDWLRADVVARKLSKMQIKEAATQEKLKAAMPAWLERGAQDLDGLVAAMKTTVKKMSKVAANATIYDYDELGALFSMAAIQVAALRNHHFGITSSAMCKRYKQENPRLKKSSKNATARNQKNANTDK